MKTSEKVIHDVLVQDLLNALGLSQDDSFEVYDPDKHIIRDPATVICSIHITKKHETPFVTVVDNRKKSIHEVLTDMGYDFPDSKEEPDKEETSKEKEIESTPTEAKILRKSDGGYYLLTKDGDKIYQGDKIKFIFKPRIDSYPQMYYGFAKNIVSNGVIIERWQYDESPGFDLIPLSALDNISKD